MPRKRRGSNLSSRKGRDAEGRKTRRNKNTQKSVPSQISADNTDEAAPSVVVPREQTEPVLATKVVQVVKGKGKSKAPIQAAQISSTIQSNSEDDTDEEPILRKRPYEGPRAEEVPLKKSKPVRNSEFPAGPNTKGKSKAPINTVQIPATSNNHCDNDDDDVYVGENPYFGPRAAEVPVQKKLTKENIGISNRDEREAGPSTRSPRILSPLLTTELPAEEQTMEWVEEFDQPMDEEILMADQEMDENLEELLRLRIDGVQGVNYLLAANRDNVVPFNLGPLNNVCPHCNSLYFRSERTTRGFYTACCFQGKIRIPPIETPEYFRNLWTNQDGRFKKFRQEILKYNNLFQFASSEVRLRDLPNAGPYVFSIQGKIYHRVSNVEMAAAAGRRQKYGPLYFLDPDTATAQRIENAAGADLDQNLIREIERELREVNPYAHGYYHLRERYEIELQRNGEMPQLTLAFVAVRGQRQFDLPAVNEVAVVYSDQEMEPQDVTLRIFLRNRPDRFKDIKLEHELSDPLLFPLLFPCGEKGWTWTMTHLNSQKRLTLADYYCYRLQYRDGAFDVIHHGTKLTQQYVVTAYVRVEHNRIDYILKNQGKFRSEEYLGLVDFMHRRAEPTGARVGVPVILPSSYNLSARAMQQHFQDCMAIVSKFGAPSLFITMTANPKWQEMTDYLRANNQREANDHPLLMARIFHEKLREFLKDITERHIFGVPLANVYVIEFQKRGLPHAHILTVLRPEDRLNEPLKIDQLISAELPEPGTVLYDEVVEKMMHVCTPSRCLENGKCSKRFPKPFASETSIQNNGHVTYRRRMTGRTVRIQRFGREYLLDNRHVVQYNPYTLLKYRCHINVEVCVSMCSLKYIFKYMFKGSDYASIKITDDNRVEYDEVEAYLNARYLSPTEASWHLQKYKMYDLSHTVYKLMLHLPDRQNIVFQPGLEVAAMERNANTQLTGWFQLNTTNPDARRYLYTEIPLHFVWNQQQRRWTPRKRGQGNIVVRLNIVNVRTRELYYLRVLLLHVRGATGFADMRTYEGTVYDTFLEACQARNLLHDDQEWVRALNEARLFQMPRQMRAMFAYILVFCEVTSPPELWQQFRDDFLQDFVRKGLSEIVAERRALRHINTILSAHNLSLWHFQLPTVDENVDEEIEVEEVVPENAAAGLIEALNDHQRNAFERIVAAMRNENVAERLFVIDAPGGCGKTYLINTLVQVATEERLGVMTMATTGIAATLLRQGRTVHSSFRIPVPTRENSVSRIRPDSDDARALRDIKLIIWDEISMANKLTLEIVNRTLKDLCDSENPFAGKTVLLCGDFMQCLPVVAHGNRNTIINNSVLYSSVWRLFVRLPLEVNVRAERDREFSEFVLAMGRAQLPTKRHLNYRDLVQIPNRCIVPNKNVLIENCFGRSIVPGTVPNAAILSPLNESCAEINFEVLKRIQGTERIYLSADTAEFENEDVAFAEAHVPVENLNAMNPPGLAPHRLILKTGAIIMLQRNLDVTQNLCNGSRLLVTELNQHFISAKRIDAISGQLTDEIVFIPRVDFLTSDTDLPFKLKRRQFPVRLAYAISINKAQGQTFDKVGIYLPRPVFSHGQLYVACSRAKSFDSVHVCILNDDVQGRIFQNRDTEVYTRNIVFEEIFEP